MLGMWTTLLRSAASKIPRAPPLHPRRLLDLGHLGRQSPGPALPPVPRSSARLVGSSLVPRRRRPTIQKLPPISITQRRLKLYVIPTLPFALWYSEA